jgi:hypothetical protein
MELTNKTLAMFLVAAIVVSLAGTIISLNKLGTLSTTGYATDTDTATASVQVNTTTSIIFTTATIDFSSGSVNTSTAGQNCTLQVGVAKSAACIGFATVNTPFVLENDGNTFVSVVLNASKPASTFIGGTAPLFQWKVANGTSTDCLGGPTPVAYTDVAASAPGTTICPNLTYVDATDTLNISVLISIPYTASAGVKTASLLATATDV